MLIDNYNIAYRYYYCYYSISSGKPPHRFTHRHTFCPSCNPARAPALSARPDDDDDGYNDLNGCQDYRPTGRWRWENDPTICVQYWIYITRDITLHRECGYLLVMLYIGTTDWYMVTSKRVRIHIFIRTYGPVRPKLHIGQTIIANTSTPRLYMDLEWQPRLRYCILSYRDI